MRTSGPHSRDSPVDLGKLRQKSGYEPQFTQLEWDALSNPAAIVFVPMVELFLLSSGRRTKIAQRTRTSLSHRTLYLMFLLSRTER